MDAVMVRSLDSLVGLRLRRGARSLSERTHNRAARKLDLEPVVLETIGIAQQDVSRAFEILLARRLAAQRGFGLRIAPRFVRHATEGEAHVPDPAAVELHTG